jgi:hypothetical protein
MVNLISAAPEMKSDGCDMAAILRYFGQFPVYVIAHPKREQRPDDNEHNQEKQPDIKRCAVRVELALHALQSGVRKCIAV